MNRIWILMLVVAYPVMALAQTGSPGAVGIEPPYQPAVPVAPTVNTYGGGYPGYSGGGTAAGNAMNGMAKRISAKGNYNLSTSAAAINMTQAQKNEIQNKQLYTNTYFEMRATNKAAREEAGPPPTMEQTRPHGPRGRAQAAGPQPSGSRHRPDQLAKRPPARQFRGQRGQVDSFSIRGPGTAASAIPTR